jgi:hypothetical protein
MNFCNRFLSLLVLVAVALAAGCISTRATLAPNAKVEQYRTFAFTPQANTAIDRTPTGAVVRDSITRELAEHGIRPASGAPPDFYVSYQLVLREQLTASNWGGWGGWGGWGWGGVGWGGWGGPDIYEYTEGTLVVDFIDPRTNSSFWRGTATSVVNTPDNPNPKTMRKGVAKMIDKYPVELVATAPGPTRL